MITAAMWSIRVYELHEQTWHGITKQMILMTGPAHASSFRSPQDHFEMGALTVVPAFSAIAVGMSHKTCNITRRACMQSNMCNLFVPCSLGAASSHCWLHCIATIGPALIPLLSILLHGTHLSDMH